MKKTILFIAFILFSYILYVSIVFVNPSKPVFGSITLGEAEIIAAVTGKKHYLIPKTISSFILNKKLDDADFRKSFITVFSHYAERDKNYEELEKYLKILILKGFDINENISSADLDLKKINTSILYFQILSESCEITKIYLKYGANPKRFIYSGSTAPATIIDIAEKELFKIAAGVGNYSISTNRLENMKCSLAAMKNLYSN